MASFSKGSIRIQIGALLSASIIAIGILQYLMFYVAVTSIDFNISSFLTSLGVPGIIVFICMILVVVAVDICVNKILSDVEEEIELQNKLNDAIQFIDNRLNTKMKS